METFEKWFTNDTNLPDCKRSLALLAFEAGYKAGFCAADNGDSDEYYKLVEEKGE